MGSQKNFTVLFGMTLKTHEIVERIQTAKISLCFTATGND